MNSSNDSNFQVGVRYALLAYCSWGLFPLFWKLLKEIPSFELLCHRLFWSFVFYTILRFLKERKYSPQLGLKRKELFYLFSASTLLSGNWLLYIYAVNSGRVVESSLGYFINPLVNILLGVVFLKESLKKHHKIAVAFVSIGVLIITLEAHSLPWVALTLAFSFSLYGFVRKKLSLNSLAGGQLETLFLIPVAFIYFATHSEQLIQHTPLQWVLVISSGVVTGLPLLWFSEAVKRLPYYLMGFFQFIAPTLMFVCGIFIYHEGMSPFKLCGFLFIWSGILYLLTTTLHNNRKATLAQTC